ncbi:MAG: hypothetical protein VB064_04925 [Oscillospiraceae bacterium]|nr:hypothetical protein [Oscillospiraceae bacterium]
MLKDDNYITVICIQTGNHKLSGDLIDGINVYSVTSPGNSLQHTIDSAAQRAEPVPAHLFYKAVQLLYKPVRGFRSLFFYPSGLRWHIKKAYSCMEEVNRHDPIDCVCAISAPFSSFIAGTKWKSNHKTVRLITFSLDTYTTGLVRNRNLLIRLFWEDYSVRLERQIFAAADFNFITIGIQNDSKSLQCYPQEKTRVLPNLISLPPVDIEAEKAPDKFIFMYCGGFYQKIRNPKYMLDTLLCIDDLNFQLDLYINSACQETVDGAIDKSNGKFIRHSYISSDEIQKEMCKADFLIDLGNSLAGATPSKTFQYIATGRPIILFAPDGYKSEALERYPLSLIINQSIHSAKEASDMIRGFCLENRSKRLCPEEIISLYPEHMWPVIMDQIRRAAYDGA